MDTRLLSATVLVVALILTAPSVAQKSSDRGVDAAAAAVAEATGGRVLSVRRKGDYYSVKVLTDGGRVRVYRVDARSGRIQR